MPSPLPVFSLGVCLQPAALIYRPLLPGYYPLRLARYPGQGSPQVRKVLPLQ